MSKNEGPAGAVTVPPGPLRVAVGSDERSHLTDAVVAELRRRGHQVRVYGALVEEDPAAGGGAGKEPTGEPTGEPGREPGRDPATGDRPPDWPLVSAAVARAVAGGEADEGLVMCWTGTGAALAANKVPGVRAALCQDAETARGARVWNHANVLALSLRSTSEPIALEILEAWFATPWSQDPWNREQIGRIADLENAAT
jgi:ribose 5-phosphate isomerase B